MNISAGSSTAQDVIQLLGYTQLELLYQGAKTMVCRAWENASSPAVIIKYLDQAYPSFGELVQFRNQYTITKNLSIPGIIRPLSLAPCGNSYALVMEDVGGVSLAKYIQGQTLTVSGVLAIALQLTNILHDLHQQRVIHKDIQPANILIHPETKQIWLIDFSIASLLPRETQTLQSPKGLEGTLAYLAPEQTGRMNRAIDYRSDFYALGVTLYELFTGQRPFTSNDPLELIHNHMTVQPPAAHELNPDIPPILSDIIIKLMAKNAENRYQSALGLKWDLEQCREKALGQATQIKFPLGERDMSDRFLIPEKLYGREAEVQILLDSFERVSEGTSELMLVAGFSGIGKTAVVNEVHKPITRQRGYFIQGKFDQFNRSTPFSAFIQAFRNLMRQLLSESDVALKHWQHKILRVVGTEGQIIVDVIPELTQIIGPQPSPTELSGAAAQNRFNRLFSQFVQIFTTKKHPLVIFLDDLQWADSASLGLLQLLMSHAEIGYLLILGAYRDNEVFPAHPLMLALEELRKHDNGNIKTLTLEALDVDNITALVADTMLCAPERAHSLAELIFQKAQGNPFFSTQFLEGLHKDGWMTYATDIGCWQCDITQVRQLALTNDVVAFMVERLQKLKPATQTVLKLASCIGNCFDLETLAVIYEQRQEDVAAALWAALQEGLVVPQSETYKFFQGQKDHGATPDSIIVDYRFLHDRVQQAAYALIPIDEQAATQYRIGRLLLARMRDIDDDALLFNVVGYLNSGRKFLVDTHEQQQLVQLNLSAAQKALSSTAYEATINYCQMGIDILNDDCWQTQYDVTRQLYQTLGSAQLSNANYEDLEITTSTAFAEITSATDRTEICVLQLVGCCLQGRYGEAIDWGLTGLKDLGVEIVEEQVPLLVEQEFERIAALMGDRTAYDLLDHNERVPSPTIQCIIKLLVAIDPPIYITGRNSLYALVGLLGTRYSIEHGNTTESAKSYANYGMLLGSIKGDYQQGYTFAEMGVELAHRVNSKAMQCQAGLMLGSFAHSWARPINGSSKTNNDSFLAGMEAGETQYAVYNLLGSVLNLLFQGENLTTLANNILPSYDAIEKRVNSEMLRIVLAGAQIFVQQLVNDAASSEKTNIITAAQAVIRAGEISGNQLGLAIHYSLEMHRCCIVGDFAEGLKFFQQLQPIVSCLMGFPTHSYYFYYGSLALLNNEFETDSALDQQRWEWIKINQQQLKIWVESCPENFLHKYLLIEAECLRVQGDRFGALATYHQAIHEAHTNGFIQEESLIHECAARLYLQQGQDNFAAPHIQEAFYGYARWGAGTKAAQINAPSPRSLTRTIQASDTTSGTEFALMSEARLGSDMTGLHLNSRSNLLLNATLDQHAIFKASQAIASNIDLNVLLTEVTRIILQNSGGDRCALLLPDDAGEWQLRAQATADETQLCRESLANHPDLPVKLLQYVKNTQETLLINNLDTDLPIIDEFLDQHQPKSILGLPILNQGQLIGILYLQNSCTSGAFTAERRSILNFLCAQAAISLENARLFQTSQYYAEQLEQSQLQVVQNEKMATLGNLVAGVAHEVNNPVGFLTGSIANAQDYLQDLFEYLKAYQSHCPPPAAVQEVAEDIDLEFLQADWPKLLASMQAATDRISGISDSLRTFSRSDTEYKVSANIHEGIDSTLLILKYRLKANDQRPAIEIVKDYGEISELNCFPGQLNQVFMNILANAIDALDAVSQDRSFAEMEANPHRITVQTSMAEGQVKVMIADNGPGIPEEIRAKIFDHLFTTKEVSKGTGLGLAIAHQIITEKHEGQIFCASQYGYGSSFTITLPL